MKKIRFLIISFLFIFTILVQNVLAQDNPIILYYGNGCSHCAEVEDFIKNNNFDFYIEQKEIYQNKANAEEFNQVCAEKGINLMNRGVPFLYAENECFIGDKQIISYLSTKQQSVETDKAISDVGGIKTNFSESLTMPILIGAALVDSINPCEFAVLLILIATILASGNKKRALLSGLAYSASIFISYFLMGLGLYSVISSFGTPVVFMKIIGGIAILIGLFNIKDYFWYGKVFLMEVPLSWRPKLKSLVRSITGPLSAFLIGFLVSLFLLPCTSGPYIVILGMLGHSETFSRAIWLLALYNLIFVFPMIIISIGMYFGMNVKKAEETRNKNLKLLHLIAGIIMIIMGLFLIL
ncbi:MAG: cytochrome c biogenesis protein CcdA [Patescibacteria group bacterium]|nr:cytochrome c biogenesis protein CcdA [Patescibacteria group bacterium]